MKKKVKYLIGITAIGLTIGAFTGCSAEKPAEKPMENQQPASVETEENIESARQEGEMELPEGIEGVFAESEAYPELEQLIIQELEIPDDYLEKTKYYYNYVDLNMDEKDEIFVVVMGPYTSGTGGSTGLIVEKGEEGLKSMQTLSLVRTPIIISDKITNSKKEIVVPTYGGGGESGYSILTANENGIYTNVPDAEMVESLEGITGTAIINNNLLKDMEDENVLNLG